MKTSYKDIVNRVEKKPCGRKKFNHAEIEKRLKEAHLQVFMGFEMDQLI